MILTQKRQKYQHYHLEKLIDINTLQVRKYYLLIKGERMHKRSFLILLQENLQKKTRTTEDQCKKQIKPIEDHGKQFVKSNEIIKKDFNINRDSIPHEEQKKYLINFLKKNLLNFRIFKKYNPNDLIYKYKTEGMSPNDFSSYQNSIDLFISLRDSNIN